LSREFFEKKIAGVGVPFFLGILGKTRSFLMVFRWLKRGELWQKRGGIRGHFAGLNLTSGNLKLFPDDYSGPAW
jgi:hypothetical protein